MRRIRIGIDVGGTFTDAVAIDEETFDLVGQVKVPTTHTAPEGVARGIIESLHRLLAETGIAPEEVRFLAHGTTQATNALLEGDVARVGILATGSGLEGRRAHSETQVGDLELAPGRWLRTVHAFAQPGEFEEALAELRRQGAAVVVAAAPFSVDDPSTEQEIMAAARRMGLPATGTHEISKLYGLRIRTRTAAINASILPRMVSTADMTEASVARAGMRAPLMVMRGDGGVMSMAEVRRRPILTMLSGPAAGVAGALMYEKVSDGIFLDVGGTSTDISAVRSGRVQVDYAEVGGHKTYVTSLDVRTVGVAGGSMVRLSGRTIKDVGPRSAHIAGLPYAVFTDPEVIRSPELETFSPLPGDPPDYVAIRCAGGERLALTTTCAANLLGYIAPGQWGHGNPESARRAFAPLAAALGCSVEEAARQVLRAAVAKVMPVVDALLERYQMERAHTVLVGGGGGAAAIVPFLAEVTGMPYRLARNHQVISPIGVAMAMVRDVVERTVPYPTEADLLRIRKEAEEAVLRAGAAPGTIEVQVEVDTTRQLVRAIATGSTEFRARDLSRRVVSPEEREAIAARSMGVDQVRLVAATDGWFVYQGQATDTRLFGLVRRSRTLTRVLDAEGVVRLSRGEAGVAVTTAGQVPAQLEQMMAAYTAYGDAGAVIPETFLLVGNRMIDCSGLQTLEQVTTMAATELAGHDPEEQVILLCVPRR